MWSESLRGSMHIAQRETKSERVRAAIECSLLLGWLSCPSRVEIESLSLLPSVLRPRPLPLPRPHPAPLLPLSLSSLPLLLFHRRQGFLYTDRRLRRRRRVFGSREERARKEGRGGTVCASENETTYWFFRPNFPITSCWKRIQSQLSNSFLHTISEFQCKCGQLCTREGQSGHAGRQRERRERPRSHGRNSPPLLPSFLPPVQPADRRTMSSP